jgi:predicted nucleic acid-binding protein
MFAALPKIALTEAALMRDGHVQEQLVQRGHHRGVKIPDLLIAAAAEAAGVRVLHTIVDAAEHPRDDVELLPAG